MRPSNALSPILLGVLCIPLLLSPSEPVDANRGLGVSSLMTSRFAVTGDGTIAFLPGPGRRSVLQVDLSTGLILDAVVLPSLINGVELSPDGRSLAVTSPTAGTVTPIDVEPLTPGPPIPGGRGPRLPEFSPNGSGLCVICPPEKAGMHIDWPSKHVDHVIPFSGRPFGAAHTSVPRCMGVSFPRAGTLEISCDHNHAPKGAVTVGPRPRWVSTNSGSVSRDIPDHDTFVPGHKHNHGLVVPIDNQTTDSLITGVPPDTTEPAQEFFLVTSRRADALYFVDAGALEVVHTLDLKNPGNLDASDKYAFVILGRGRSVAVVDTDSTSPDFGNVVNTVRFHGTPVEAVRVARETGVCYALTRDHKKLYSIDPETLPLDGSRAMSGDAIRIHREKKSRERKWKHHKKSGEKNKKEKKHASSDDDDDHGDEDEADDDDDDEKKDKGSSHHKRRKGRRDN